MHAYSKQLQLAKNETITVCVTLWTAACAKLLSTMHVRLQSGMNFCRIKQAYGGAKDVEGNKNFVGAFWTWALAAEIVYTFFCRTFFQIAWKCMHAYSEQQLLAKMKQNFGVTL